MAVKKKATPKTKTPKKMGRPLIKIDWKKVQSLCKIQCTGEEIAGVLGIDYDTLNNALIREKDTTFSDYFKKHSAGGRFSLRRRQFKIAEEGNPTMLIWLGKQYLGQKEKQEVGLVNGGEDDKPFQIEFINPSDESTASK